MVRVRSEVIHIRKKKEELLKYYSIDNLLKQDAIYRMVIGERSNGKTYACLSYCLEKCWKRGEQFAYIRRWKDDMAGSRGETLFDGLAKDGVIKRITGGEFTDMYYYARKWYLCRYEDVVGADGEIKERKCIKSEKPICYGFAISMQEHDKSTSYPVIHTVFFDEFLTRSDVGYLSDEFVLYMNLLSTIIRDKGDVEIFMAANTVSQYAPYFQEMGLVNIKKMKPGQIELYTYPKNPDLKVAIEFSDSPNKNGKPSDKYFAFDNPRLSMITGQNGIWEFAMYPHAPTRWLPKHEIFRFFVSFDRELLECTVVSKDRLRFLYINRKTTPLKYPDKDLIYTDQPDARPNWRSSLITDDLEVSRKIATMYRENKVFYQDNAVGEIFRAYIQNAA